MHGIWPGHADGYLASVPVSQLYNHSPSWHFGEDLWFTVHYVLFARHKVYFWSFSAATNTTELFLIGLRIKYLCSQVWRKVNYGLRSTENFQNDILKMSLPFFPLVYHNGIMSLRFISCNLSLFSFPVFCNLWSYSSTPTLWSTHSLDRQRWTWEELGDRDDDSGEYK